MMVFDMQDPADGDGGACGNDGLRANVPHNSQHDFVAQGLTGDGLRDAGGRQRLPSRRNAEIFSFDHDGISYRASLGRFADGAPAGLFLDTGKFNAAVQVNAETAAVLVSLLLQYGVELAAIRHSIAGPIGAALDRIAQAEISASSTDGEAFS